MEIAGAIFDCDGTLLDSMGMWDRIFLDLLASEGHPHREDLVYAAESMNVHDECDYLHEACGAGRSGEDLYQKLKALLTNAYAHDVQPFPDARLFLKRLQKRQIPLVIATTTEEKDVRAALAVHGLDGFFKAIVSSSDLGRGKEFPDVYEKALAALGTPKALTPVFEDAPFACKTAAQAGFSVVGFVREGDRRKREDFTPWCTLIAQSFDEIELEPVP